MTGRRFQPDGGTSRPVIRLAQTDSTNRYLKEHGAEYPVGAVCYTDDQRAGRGRLGRTWEMPSHTALALSVLWYPQGDPRMLPLVCGVAASRAIEDVAPLSAYIKWPNDIICGNRKVCGILCESGMRDGRLYVIAGLGINLTQSAADFEKAGLPHAASLYTLTGDTISVDEMAAALINRLDEGWAQFQTQGSASLPTAFRERCITLGKPVQVLGAEPFTGVAVDVDDDGNLLVDTPDGTRRTVNAGEVSVRGLYGYV